MRSDMAINNRTFNYTFKLNQRMHVGSILGNSKWEASKIQEQKHRLNDRFINTISKQVEKEYVNTTCNPPLLAIRRFRQWMVFNYKWKLVQVLKLKQEINFYEYIEIAEYVFAKNPLRFCKRCCITDSIVEICNEHYTHEEVKESIVDKFTLQQFYFEQCSNPKYHTSILLNNNIVGYITQKNNKDNCYWVILELIKRDNEADILFDNYKFFCLKKKFNTVTQAKFYLNYHCQSFLTKYKFRT